MKVNAFVFDALVQFALVLIGGRRCLFAFSVEPRGIEPMTSLLPVLNVLFRSALPGLDR